MKHSMRNFLIPALGRIGSAVVLAAAPLSSALADAGGTYSGYGHGGGHMWDGGSWGHLIFGPLMMIAIVAAIVVVVVLAVRWLGPTGSSARTPSGALETLRQRYARGEIERDDFQRMKEDLS